jgi:hypothetical protein
VPPLTSGRRPPRGWLPAAGIVAAALALAVGAPAPAGAQAKAPAGASMAKAQGREPARKAQETVKPPEPAASEECLACHADEDLQRSAKRRGRGMSVFVDATTLEGSQHAGLDCVSCHTTATAPHDETLPPVSCAGCHGDAPESVATGAHGSPAALRAGARAPTCASCHGAHDVRDPATLGTETCARCHRAEVALYRDSIHGRARAGGDSEAATCVSCHGPAHTLGTKTDPESWTYHLNLPRTCAQCHADAEMARRHGIAAGDVYKLFMDSIHGRAITKSGLLVAANCSDCHGAHDIKAHTNPASRVFRANLPATCGTCHAGVLREYRASVHGQAVAAGSKAAPICVDCHSAHEIRRVEADRWKLEIVRECGTCHKESLGTYRDTFHGKVTALGFTRVARCSDCHGAHDIYPTRDVRSTVNPANLVATCAQCHPAANENFARYDPHADPTDVNRSALLHYTWRFMIWLLVGTFSFFGVHTVLWGVRSLVGLNGGRQAPPPAGGSGKDAGDA